MVVPFSKKLTIYIIAQLSFTLLAYGTAIHLLLHDQLFVTLLLLGSLNLLISSRLENYTQTLSKLKKALLLLGILALVTTEGTLFTSLEFVPTVSVTTTLTDNANIGVYEGLSNRISTIDWGTIYPGSSKNVTVHISNESNTTIILSLSTKDWNPESAKNYITLSWDYNGQMVAPHQNTRITLTLHVSENTKEVTNFTFNIVITAEQAP
jgi:hypothetical protein